MYSCTYIHWGLILHVNLVLFYSQLHVQHFYCGVTSHNCEVLVMEGPWQHAYLPLLTLFIHSCMPVIIQIFVEIGH